MDSVGDLGDQLGGNRAIAGSGDPVPDVAHSHAGGEQGEHEVVDVLEAAAPRLDELRLERALTVERDSDAHAAVLGMHRLAAVAVAGIAVVAGVEWKSSSAPRALSAILRRSAKNRCGSRKASAGSRPPRKTWTASSEMSGISRRGGTLRFMTYPFCNVQPPPGPVPVSTFPPQASAGARCGTSPIHVISDTPRDHDRPEPISAES